MPWWQHELPAVPCQKAFSQSPAVSSDSGRLASACLDVVVTKKCARVERVWGGLVKSMFMLFLKSPAHAFFLMCFYSQLAPLESVNCVFIS